MAELPIRTAGHLPTPGGDWTGIGNGLIVPSQFVAVVEDEPDLPDLELTIETSAGRPRCAALVVRESAGAGVTTARLRDIPLKQLVSTAVASVALRVSTQGPDAWKIEPLSDVGVTGAYGVASDAPDRDLEAVATVYRAAIAAGDLAPTRAVKRAFNLSTKTAQRRVRAARDAGLPMPPAPRRPNREDT